MTYMLKYVHFSLYFTDYSFFRNITLHYVYPTQQIWNIFYSFGDHNLFTFIYGLIIFVFC